VDYENQLVIQLQPDGPGEKALNEISKGLYLKNFARSSLCEYNITMASPTLAHVNGAAPRIGQRTRIYLVFHSNGQIVANCMTPMGLAQAINPMLSQLNPQGYSIGKIVLMTCYGLAPPDWSGVVGHNITVDLARLFFEELAMRLHAPVTKCSAYGSMVAMDKGHKVMSFNGASWASHKEGGFGIKKTLIWDGSGMKIKTAMKAPPPAPAPTPAPVIDSLELGEDDPMAMDID
jgi:hypothetical protein